jgi:enoyl-CoA hydratase
MTAWTLERRGRAVVVVMRSNPVNKMNGAFFEDLNRALDRVEQEHPKAPLVLTAEGGTFSAGLDFDDVFPRFASASAYGEVAEWFITFRASLLRVFMLERMTVAAVNGHAFAGGLILALACDHRIGPRGSARFGLNEVPIGIPMPSVYTEIIRHKIGSAQAEEAILSGRTYDALEARAAGFFQRLVEPERVLPEALIHAELVGEDAFEAYAFSKKALLAPVLDFMAGASRRLDEEALRVARLPSSIREQSRALDRLRARRG